jgi:hypothetical protein
MAIVRALFVASLGWWAACGGSATAGPCEGLDPAQECNASCSFDDDCAAGFHCGDDGTCDAQCTPGGDQCGDGFVCSDDGRCVAGDGPDAGDDNSCPRVSVGLEPEIPTVVILIDQSGSMNDDFSGVSRWQATKTALIDPTDGAISKLESVVKFKAVLYTSHGGNDGGTCPILEETSGPPALDNYAAIAGLLNSNDPDRDTPTAEAIDAVLGSFPIPDPENPGPQVLLLATDGNPDNCVDSDAHDAGSRQMSEDAVGRVWDAGIMTIPLSVGTDIAQDHLERLADIGIGAAPGSGQGTAYVATTPQALVDAFEEIIYGVRGCQITVDGTLDPNRADEGDITLWLDGVMRDLIYGDDWIVVDENTIELVGQTCQDFLDASDVMLSGEFPCGVVIK